MSKLETENEILKIQLKRMIFHKDQFDTLIKTNIDLSKENLELRDEINKLTQENKDLIEKSKNKEKI